MTKFFLFIRKYPVSILLFIIIWILSLMPFFPETPLDDVKFIDKWTHLIMYGGTCSVLWIEYMRSHKTKGSAVKLFLLAWLAPILMSGLLELLQAYATTTRSGEWLDFAANSLGVTLGAAVGLLLMKKYKDIRLN
ncbi:MAG: VanZ family protein [Prevotella sp.]|nr:VanZ family protein [Prevotella sp.]